jgi:hypothetical protein
MAFAGMLTPSRLAGVVLLLPILACASGAPETRVQNYGPGTYIITYSSIFGPAKARTAAIRDANAFCSANDSQMHPVDEQTIPGEVSSFSLMFSCGTSATSQQRTQPVPDGVRPVSPSTEPNTAVDL